MEITTNTGGQRLKENSSCCRLVRSLLAFRSKNTANLSSSSRRSHDELTGGLFVGQNN